MAQKGPWLLRMKKWSQINIDGDQFPLDDLGYLLRHADTLRELSIDGEQAVDFDTLNQLHGLERLTIDSLDEAAPDGVLELRRFPHLTELQLWSPIRIDWTDAPALEHLHIYQPTESDFTAISALTSLEYLHLELPSRVPDLSSPNLQELSVAGWHTPAERPIRGLGSVTELELVGLAGHRDLSAFAGTGALVSFELVDAWELESLAGLRLADGAAVELADCPHLKDLAGVDAVPGVELSIVGVPLLDRG